jgi:hypothetical protein
MEGGSQESRAVATTRVAENVLSKSGFSHPRMTFRRRTRYHGVADMLKCFIDRAVRTAASQTAHSLVESLEGRRLLAAGHLDPTFGRGGVVRSEAAAPVGRYGRMIAL